MANDTIPLKGALREIFQEQSSEGPVLGNIRTALRTFRDRTADMTPQEISALMPDLISNFDAALAHGERVTKSDLTDALTGLPNRRAFDAKLQELVSKGETFSLVMVDIDHFKKFNDTYGHKFGDIVLAQVAKAMTHVRDGFAARYGGEEMAILIPGANETLAHKLADRVRLEVQGRVFTDHSSTGKDGPPPITAHTTVSMGVAGFVKGDTTETLFARSDDYLYEAKAQGRNRVISEKPDLPARKSVPGLE